MSEWLMFNAKTAIFQLYHGENKLQSYHDDDVRFIQDKVYLLVLAHWNKNPPVDISLHVDTLSLIRANKSLFFYP